MRTGGGTEAAVGENKQNKQTNTRRVRGGSCEAQLYTYEDRYEYNVTYECYLALHL